MTNVPEWARSGNDIIQDLPTAQRSVIDHPNNPMAWVKYGSAHYLMARAGPDHHIEAPLAYERAMTIAPDFPAAAMGLAMSSYAFKQHAVALDLVREAQRNKPYREAELLEGNILLKLGMWQEGWEKCEARLDRPGWRTKRFTGSLSDLKDRTVIVRGEQGYGDNIQFSRYVHQ